MTAKAKVKTPGRTAKAKVKTPGRTVTRRETAERWEIATRAIEGGSFDDLAKEYYLSPNESPAEKAAVAAIEDRIAEMFGFRLDLKLLSARYAWNSMTKREQRLFDALVVRWSD